MSSDVRTRWKVHLTVTLEARGQVELPDDADVADEFRGGLYRRMIDLSDPANHGWRVAAVRVDSQEQP